MRKINFYCVDNRGCFTATMDLGANYPKETVLAQKEQLINTVKKNYPNVQSVDMLIPTKSKYKKELLMEVGQEVASGWGGVCLGITTYDNLVEFTSILTVCGILSHMLDYKIKFQCSFISRMVKI